MPAQGRGDVIGDAHHGAQRVGQGLRVLQTHLAAETADVVVPSGEERAVRGAAQEVGVAAAVDLAEIVLGFRSQAQAMPQRHAGAQEGLVDAATACTLVLDVAHLGEEFIGVLFGLEVIRHAADGHHAHLEGRMRGDGKGRHDVVHVEGVVGGTGGAALIERVAVFQPEVHHEGLLLARRDGGGVQDVDVTYVAVGDADAAHRLVVGGAQAQHVAESEEGVGRIGAAGQRIVVLCQDVLNRGQKQEAERDQQCLNLSHLCVCFRV